jgi:hypothetical protein
VAALHKTVVLWATGAGGPGVSVFYSAFGVDITVPLATFFNAIKASFPPVVTWQIPTSGDVLDDVSGAITGAWIGGTGASIAGTGSAQYFAGTGAYARWTTGAVHNRRKVYGRTFLCPIINAGADNDGTIGGGTLATLQGATATLGGGSYLRVWHRPTTTTSNDGVSFPVISGSVPDKTTSLKTRRS